MSLFNIDKSKLGKTKMIGAITADLLKANSFAQPNFITDNSIAEEWA